MKYAEIRCTEDWMCSMRHCAAIIILVMPCANTCSQFGLSLWSHNRLSCLNCRRLLLLWNVSCSVYETCGWEHTSQAKMVSHTDDQNKLIMWTTSKTFWFSQNVCLFIIYNIIMRQTGEYEIFGGCRQSEEDRKESNMSLWNLQTEID